MPGLVPGIHALLMDYEGKTWMAGSSPAMTEKDPGYGLYALCCSRTRFSTASGEA